MPTATNLKVSAFDSDGCAANSSLARVFSCRIRGIYRTFAPLWFRNYPVYGISERKWNVFSIALVIPMHVCELVCVHALIALW